MSDTKIEAASVAKVSQFLLGASVLVGLFVTFRIHALSSSFGELFMGMNIQLPVLTKLLLTPLSRVVAPTILVILIVKELGLKDKPLLTLGLNAVGLLALVVVHEVFVFAGIAPLIQLVENLG